MHIIHVCKPETARGARVLSQLLFAQNNSSILQIKKHFWIPFGLYSPLLIKLAISGSQTAFIFHQQVSLPSLLSVYIINLFRQERHVLVYDVHDALHLEKQHSGWQLNLYCFLESIVFLVNVRVLTVSPGISALLQSEYKKAPFVVCSLSSSLLSRVQLHIANKTTSTNSTNHCLPFAPSVIYFGVIDTDRLDLNTIAELVNRGYSFSLMGRFASSVSKSWQDELLSLVRKSCGTIGSMYSPDKLDFLLDYNYLLLSYGSQSSNYHHALPNKLFQALSYHLTVIVDESMSDIISIFSGSGYIVDIRKLLDETISIFPSPRNPKLLALKYESIYQESRKNFLDATRAA